MKRFLLALVACFSLGAALVAAPVRVVTLHSVLTEIVTEVGGPETAVTGLVRPGVDPHTFNPAPSDVRRLVQADIVFFSGFGLEPYLDKLVANSGTKARLVRAADAIPNPVHSSCRHAHHHHAYEEAADEPDHESDADHDADEDHEEFDPHWWHGLANVRAVTLQVRDALATLRPEAKAGFEARAAVYLEKIDALAAWAQQEVAVLPAARRCLVTNHDAFGYLVRDYGFTVHPLQGVNPEAEPNARELAELIDFIRREKIPAVFADNTENPKLLAAMIRETGAKLGGTLYADGLGAAGTPATTFADMYRHNLGTIVSALK